MPTDDERREVARRLRGLNYSDLQESLICAYLDALGIKGYKDWVGIAHRLADLIEPSGHECVPGECPLNVRHDSDSIDREELLALADDLDYAGAAVENVAYIDQTFHEAARRIREALGEGES